jgi:hypothetical protein
MNRITPVRAAVLATLVAVAGAAFAQAGPGSGAGMRPTEPGAQSGAMQQEHERLQEQLRLLEQSRVKEGGK